MWKPRQKLVNFVAKGLPTGKVESNSHGFGLTSAAGPGPRYTLSVEISRIPYIGQASFLIQTAVILFLDCSLQLFRPKPLGMVKTRVPGHPHTSMYGCGWFSAFPSTEI